MVFGQNRLLGRNEESVEFSLFLCLKAEKGPKIAKIAKNTFSVADPLLGQNPMFFRSKSLRGAVFEPPGGPPGRPKMLQNPTPQY